MARIEKTVFISYRRTDVYTALAVYENLKNHGYDVFFDYRSISSGDFEQIITSNIRARAHFLLILTPTALDRCNEPSDWLRREIELATDEKRNIVPLFFKGFRFGSPSVSEKLTGKLRNLSRYNGLNVHEDYFDEAMHRVRTQYLNIPLETVLHPVSTEVQKVVREEQVAADKALEQIEDVKELVKQVEERPNQPKAEQNQQQKILAPPVDVPRQGKVGESPIPRFSLNFRVVGGIVGGLFIISLLIWGGLQLFRNLPAATPEPTSTTQNDLGILAQASSTSVSPPAKTNTPSPTQTTIPPTLTFGVGSTMISEKDGMTLLYVPAGEFAMGSNYEFPPDAAPTYRDFSPQYTVTLDAFWIDQTEVTNKQYAMCVSAGDCTLPLILRSPLRSSYYGDSQYADYPVIYVDWFMANAYCEWAGRRLPTEAEWEKAARGTDGRIYPWGNDPPNDTLLNYNNYWTDTSVVRQYPAGKSPYGAYDMAGNVWEWTSSLYMPYPYDATDGREDLSGTRERVLRGGSWYFEEGNAISIFRAGVAPADFLVRSDVRGWAIPSFSSGRNMPYGAGTLGFRCAMSANP